MSFRKKYINKYAKMKYITLYVADSGFECGTIIFTLLYNLWLITTDLLLVIMYVSINKLILWFESVNHE